MILQELKLNIKQKAYNGSLHVGCCIVDATLRCLDSGKLALNIYGLGHNEITLSKKHGIIQGNDGYYKAAIFPHRGNLAMKVLLEYA